MLVDCSDVVTRTTLLAPIRYPLEASSEQTLNHAIDLADQFDDVQLLILHVNVLHKGKDVDRAELRHAIEEEIELPVNSSCHVRDSYLIEKEILNEADYQNADYVIIGESMRSRWRQLLAERLGVGIDLESVLRDRSNAEVVVV